MSKRNRRRRAKPKARPGPMVVEPDGACRCGRWWRTFRASERTAATTATRVRVVGAVRFEFPVYAWE